ncbi:MAG: hypothetical protein ACK4GT_01025 [Pararhodobacter sp.]
MKLKTLLLASTLAFAGTQVWAQTATPTAPTAQDCSAWLDEIGEILNEGAEASMSSSSGGQAVAAARESQAREEGAHEDGEETTDPVPVQDPAREAEAVEDAELAGGGGDRIMQAIARLEAARADLGDGQPGACEEAVTDIVRVLVLPQDD